MLPCAQRGGDRDHVSSAIEGDPAPDHRCRALHRPGAGVHETIKHMKIVIALGFLLIVGSLGSALFFMMRDKGRTRNTARALGFRVAFSIALFLLLLAAHQLGWIQPTGVPVGLR
jgi:hypothetical protein